jgi:hypothetical protein
VHSCMSGPVRMKDMRLRQIDNGRNHSIDERGCSHQNKAYYSRFRKISHLCEYPFHDRTVQVTRCGRICIGHRKVNLSTVFAGQVVGIREVDDKIWLVSFMDYDLGYFDEEEARVEPGPNPFVPDV